MWKFMDFTVFQGEKKLESLFLDEQFWWNFRFIGVVKFFDYPWENCFCAERKYKQNKHNKKKIFQTSKTHGKTNLILS